MTTEPILIYWHDAVMTHDAGEGVFDAPPSELLFEQTPHPGTPVALPTCGGRSRWAPWLPS